ncbi:MAG: dihydrolipoamide acetyltransferase family protein [Gammaproteobacteria bacterium]|nr:dihydrolipoamide acetyltransferase family protein [Gammaproteobacteria bacterium]MCY4276831.1 dihydrolipoamide acetyltransferase family protein [Gammaproteobacteria bacterium]MCY4324257.1 dihydrolipoamide acetyltransferase family protein [Gammaproteobacteria bacterium]
MSGAIHAIAVPKWGIEMIEGTLNAWRKDVGDDVALGEALLELESDKIVNTLEAGGSGVLRRQLAAPGQTLEVGALLGIIAGEDVEDAEVESFIAKWQAAEAAKAGPAGAKQVESAAPKPEAAPPVRSNAGAAQGNVRVSPVVRRRAAELGLDLSQVRGSGRGGRITKEDVEEFGQSSDSEVLAAQAPSYDEQPLSGMRRTIARRMQGAKQDIPHFYLTIDLPLDGLNAHRARLNEEAGALRVSVNDLLIWCIGQALKAVPEINVQYGENDTIRQFRHVDISVGVATERGLITPVLRSADCKSAWEIASDMAVLAQKARAGKLSMDEIEGGTFTLSNLGMMDVREFAAIINPPQAAILAAGKSEQRVVIEDGEMCVRTRMTVTLSCDHRVVDGAVAAKFLQSLTHQIANLG